MKYKCEWKIKEEDMESFELIMCPYCSARLNRVGKNNLIPTSCHECMHQRFNPKVISVKEVIEAEIPTPKLIKRKKRK